MEIGGRTLVPVRAVSEAFDCTVGWDEKSSTVSIKTKDTDKLLSLDLNYISANKFESVDGKKTYIKRGLTQVAGNKLIEWENSDVKDLYLSARVHHEMLDDDSATSYLYNVEKQLEKHQALHFFVSEDNGLINGFLLGNTLYNYNNEECSFILEL